MVHTSKRYKCSRHCKGICMFCNTFADVSAAATPPSDSELSVKFPPDAGKSETSFKQKCMLLDNIQGSPFFMMLGVGSPLSCNSKGHFHPLQNFFKGYSIKKKKILNQLGDKPHTDTRTDRSNEFDPLSFIQLNMCMCACVCVCMCMCVRVGVYEGFPFVSEHCV